MSMFREEARMKSHNTHRRGASREMRISLRPGLVRRTVVAVVPIAFSLFAGLSSLGVPAASALPPGRHYEMVSPVHKGGFGATKIGAVVPDGESVGYYSAGVFEGQPSGGGIHANYLARRGPSKWQTTPLGVPPSLLDVPFVDLSPDLSVEFAVGSPGPSGLAALREQVGLWLHPTDSPDTAAGWDVIDEVGIPGREVGLAYTTATATFCHILFESTSGMAAVLPEAEGAVAQLFEYNRGCDGEPAGFTLVGVNNQNGNKGKIINRNCEVEPGVKRYVDSSSEQASGFNAISADGSEVFFTDCLSGETVPASPHQLFVRLGESRTLEISRPLEAGAFGGCVGEADGTPGEVPCAGSAVRASANFVGASEDGSKVYFRTTAQLVSGDQDTGYDLYMATIGCPRGESKCQVAEREVTSLTQVSHDPNSGAGEVLGVLRVAPDGQRVYFVASGDLLGSSQRQALESEGRPVPEVGAANLYMYDSAAGGVVSFVGDLCTGAERSGTAEDFRCPSASADTRLWTFGGETAGESQTAGPSGEYLVFATYAQLSSADINQAKDVYRYDAATGVLSLVSLGEDGYDPNGGSGTLGSGIAQGHRGGTVFQQYEMDIRAISEDGSRIVFTSGEPLSLSATNGLVNAYEWHAGPKPGEGSVALVSTGSDPEAVKEVAISPDGSGVFFVTAQGLVPQDTDGAPDVYDARLGGDFPAAAAERQPCEGDGCQGPLTNPAPLLVPGSVSQAPGNDFSPAPAVAVPVKAKGKPKPSKCRRGYTRDPRGRCVKARRRGHRARTAAVMTRRRGDGSIRGGRS